MQNIEYYLEDLESRIDVETEEQLLNDWRSFWLGKNSGEYFEAVRRQVTPATIEWPQININDAFESLELMLISELANVSRTLASPVGRIMNVRANYGTGILPSLFGMKLFMMDRIHNTLPTAIPQGIEVIKPLLDAGTPCLNRSLGAKVFETTAYFQDKIKNYPKVKKYIFIYHPDMQGPLDILELIWGSEFFMATFDEPQLVKDFLGLMTDTYIAFMDKYLDMVQPSDKDFSAHWGLYIKGQIALRNDSAVNLSGEMYEEFVRPYDEKILNRYNGGIIHYCGKGDHFVNSMCSIKNLNAIHLSQPHLNDMEKVFSNSIDKGKRIVWLRENAVDDAIKAKRLLHGLVNRGQENL